MKIERFIYFVAIADAGSISAAARNCYISQSALSQQMEALEKELGVSLLIRRRDGIRLSEQGYQLLPKARQLIASYTDILQTIKADQTKTHLRIGYSGPLEQQLLQKTIPLFHRRMPHVDVQVSSYAMADIEDALRTCRCDIALAVPGEINPTQFYHEHILTRPIYVAVSTQCSLAQVKSLKLSDLITYPFVILREEVSNQASHTIHQWLLDQGWSEQNIVYADNIESQLMMVEVNTAISMMPYGKYSDAITLLPLDESGIAEHISEAVWRNDNECNRQFLKLLKQTSDTMK